MGKLLDTLIGNSNTLDESEYKPFDHTNSALKTEATMELKTTKVNNKSDMLNVEQALRSGDIIIMEIGKLTGGLTQEELLEFIHKSVTETDGDIVRRKENEIIITPSSVHISRSKL